MNASVDKWGAGIIRRALRLNARYTIGQKIDHEQVNAGALFRGPLMIAAMIVQIILAFALVQFNDDTVERIEREAHAADARYILRDCLECPKAVAERRP